MKSIQLFGSSVDLARRIVDLTQELAERQHVIEERANAELSLVQEEILTEARAAFALILAQSGIPADEQDVWKLHTSFLKEHGIAVLVLDENQAVVSAFLRSQSPDVTKH